MKDIKDDLELSESLENNSLIELARKWIETGEAKLIEEGESLHVFSQTFEAHGILINCYWSCDSNEAFIETYNIDEQFEEDLKLTNNNLHFLRKLPDEIFERELKKRKLQLEIPKTNFDTLNNKIEKFLEEVSVEEFIGYFEELGYKFEKNIKMKIKRNIAKR